MQTRSSPPSLSAQAFTWSTACCSVRLLAGSLPPLLLQPAIINMMAMSASVNFLRFFISEHLLSVGLVQSHDEILDFIGGGGVEDSTFKLYDQFGRFV